MSSQHKKVDYTTPGASGYQIPDILYDDPQTRKLRVVTIGAGLSGISVAYQVQKQCENVELVVYEKNADVGGTWWENKYPGCACDVPSHAYAFHFAPNPEWPRFFSEAKDIWQYYHKICEVFDLYKYMVFNTEVIKATWIEDLSQWKIQLRQTSQGKLVREFDDTCDILAYATGALNNYKWPEISDLDRFNGKLIHTANWPEDYQAQQWKGQNVVVIGSGASSIQVVPKMQPFVKHMDVFVRTGVWFANFLDEFPQDYQYSLEQKESFKRNPEAMIQHVKKLGTACDDIIKIVYMDSDAQKAGKAAFKTRMCQSIKDPRLLQGFTPSFAAGCRRVTPGDRYMAAIQKENVDVHFTAAVRCTPDGLIGEDGVERKCDTIVCATGFDVSFRPRFPVIGRDGKNLQQQWAEVPQSYLGLAVPDMPNFFMFAGPAWPLANGSATGPLGAVARYIVAMIKKMQRDHIKSLAPKQNSTDLFNAHVQEWYTHTVWKDSCRSWFKNNDTGRIIVPWPGSSLHYIKVIEYPKYEDYDITYLHSNPWAALGMGLVKENVEEQDKLDLLPYWTVENIDPRWAKAMGISLPNGK